MANSTRRRGMNCSRGKVTLLTLQKFLNQYLMSSNKGDIQIEISNINQTTLREVDFRRGVKIWSIPCSARWCKIEIVGHSPHNRRSYWLFIKYILEYCFWIFEELEWILQIRENGEKASRPTSTILRSQDDFSVCSWIQLMVYYSIALAIIWFVGPVNRFREYEQRLNKLK